MVDTDLDPLIWQLGLQVFLIAINAVLACAEIAVISINDAKLELLSESGDSRAKRLLTLTSQPARLLATTQVGITLAGFLGSAFAANNFANRLVNQLILLGITLPLSFLRTASVVTITLVLSYITLVFGELVPKRLALKRAEVIGLRMSGTIFLLSKLFKPLVELLTVSTDAILRLMSIDPNEEDEGVSEEEIRIMVDASSDKGSIDVEEKEFIHNLFDFNDITAEEIMTHRTDVSMLWLEESDEEWERTIYESRFSFYPICADSQDNIVGVLSAKDYLRLRDRHRETILEQAVKPAQLVPETVRADTLLRNMRKNRNHFAIVMDDYGGMSGVISINDLLEQLVGDMDDDSEGITEATLIEAVDTAHWRIRGTAPLDEVAEALGIDLPCDEYDTFAGMVFGYLGHIPADGSTIELECYGLKVDILLIQDHRLETALVSIAEV
ncbi:MAG: hemolysin family protein [Symbiobacteriaceae bacterium]|nr:hemolysin family protein [Symbiobacteriaceae bacterium]